MAASDKAVVTVWRRERRQKGECLAAKVAKSAPDENPIMIFVVSLFAAAAMADDRIAFTSWASPQNNPGASGGPIGFRVVLPGGKWDNKNRSKWGLCEAGPAKIGAEAEPSSYTKLSTGKRITLRNYRCRVCNSEDWPVKCDVEVENGGCSFFMAFIRAYDKR
jgi:hypothetical protein